MAHGVVLFTDHHTVTHFCHDYVTRLTAEDSDMILFLFFITHTILTNKSITILIVIGLLKK